MNQAFNSTRFPGRQESWLWIVIALLLAGPDRTDGCLGGAAGQRPQRRSGPQNSTPEPLPGDVRIGGGVAEQALKQALAERPDLAGATVATYEVRGEPALKIRLQPRQGVAPHLLAADVSALVEALDAVVGKRTPVLIHIGAGARTRFSRAERVRCTATRRQRQMRRISSWLEVDR